MRRLWKPALLVLALAAIAGGLAWQRLRPLPVPVAAVARDVPIRVFGLGTIEAQVLSRIGFDVAGTLRAVHADHGDSVEEGQVLAELADATQAARVARAEAAVHMADAVAQRAEAARERAEALLTQKQANSRRRRELAARGSGSIEAAEQAETEVATAMADLAVNRADAAVARASRADAAANLLAERTTLEKHRLAAPFAALVIQRHREPGAPLNPGEAVFTLVAPGTVWALAHIDEGRAGGLRLGQPATVRMRSRPGEPIAAEVVRIGLESDRVTEERRVYLRCGTCPAEVYLGEQIEAEIETGRLASALLIPEAAMAGFDGAGGQVWVIEDGRLARRAVRVIARTLDARFALAPDAAGGLPVATEIVTGFAVGRRAVARPP
ncbi:efflux RND transporter periplasmic adaptor subunit [Elioraea rosea]|uniref:efflux RND transporter periplasmic adaptor subunit n=1 Tax=Elioraea rosea TaxID=2492390 RepID=UPI001182488C|nr:HlyD family efflux transporter periplasmic adaptor subunit [Elioraea rosea]